MGRKSKYKKKYAKELLNGIRRTPRLVSQTGVVHGWTIEWLCIRWDISPRTYDRWVGEYTSFAEAHEVGKRDFAAFIEEQYDEAMYDKRVNGGLMKFKMQNIHGWTDKKQVETKNEEQIHRVVIERLEAPNRALENKQDDNIIDIRPSIQEKAEEVRSDEKPED